jgi:hypothetical protein
MNLCTLWCLLQVTKSVVQDHYEAGQVPLAAAVTAISGASRGSVAVSSNASTTTVLDKQPGMVVTVTVDAGQPTSFSVAGESLAAVMWTTCPDAHQNLLS